MRVERNNSVVLGSDIKKQKKNKKLLTKVHKNPDKRFIHPFCNFFYAFFLFIFVFLFPF